MRLELTGRHITITPAVRTEVERRIAPVLRRLNDRALSAQVVLTKQKAGIHAEVTLHARGVHFLHGKASARDMQGAFWAAVEKVERQADKLKGKTTVRKGGTRAVAGAPVAEPAPPRTAAGPRIIRERRSAMKPMSIEDAAAEVGENGGAVLVFRNSSTGTVSILFRRPDGNLGLIEPTL
jgi:putative sigma-54 modulation protein